MKSKNMKSIMLSKYGRTSSAALGIATALGIAAALSGCGGTTTNGQGNRATIPSTPTAYGLNATLLANGTSQEISGLESADETQFYLTAATASTAVPINTIQGATGSIPLGFPSAGAFQNGNVGKAFVPNQTSTPQSVRFRVSISNGADASGVTYPITSVSLTSPDLPGQTIPLTFDNSQVNNTSFGLANATYATAPFTLPTSLATGLHTFTVTVTDSKPTTTTTTYSVVVVRSSDAAALVVTSAGSNVSIANPIAGTVNPATGDEQGEAVLFAGPGANVVVTGPAHTDGTPANTENVNLTGGHLTIADSGTPL